MYNDVPTTCFGRSLNGHHQVGIQCQRDYIPTSIISIDISISVSTVGGGRDLVYKYRACVFVNEISSPTPPFPVLTIILMSILIVGM